jgi:transcription initiation factor TFIIF subunit beta
MERWSRVEAPNSHLATVRVYNNTDKGTRYFLLLPRETPEALGRELTEDDMDIFELDMVKNTVENQFIVAQKPKAGTDPRARIRQTAFIGNVHTECNARPLFSESYQARVRARNQAANTPLRTIQMMEDHVSGGQGAINRLASGVANGRGFSDLVVSAPLPRKSSHLTLRAEVERQK